MHTIAKITPADYPDLLAAVDAGISQRELARRYGCASSLVARHVARAKHARELSDRTEEPDLGLSAEPHNGSMREILEARIRDPNTSARDLASLTNALAHLKDEETLASGGPARARVEGVPQPPNPSVLGPRSACVKGKRRLARPSTNPSTEMREAQRCMLPVTVTATPRRRYAQGAIPLG